MRSLQPSFSHIYVEESARRYQDCSEALARFPRAIQVPICTYKEVFNRSRQSFGDQKRSQKLILAVKRDGFLYPGSQMSPDCGYRNFYYNSLAMNCLYDCEYCYLQGLYPSANLVLFVNNEDFFASTREQLAKTSPLYLCLSYDTDLLAIEGILPYCRRWIGLAAQEPDLILEIRTKSAAYSALRQLEPRSNVVLAWSISPQAVIDACEHRTASLRGRLDAAARAAADGWPVRLCIDPILAVPGWKELYSELVAQLAQSLPHGSIEQVSVGAFRTNTQIFKRMREAKPSSAVLRTGLARSGSFVSYGPELESALIDHVLDELTRKLPSVRASSAWRTPAPDGSHGAVADR